MWREAFQNMPMQRSSLIEGFLVIFSYNSLQWNLMEWKAYENIFSKLQTLLRNSKIWKYLWLINTFSIRHWIHFPQNVISWRHLTTLWKKNGALMSLFPCVLKKKKNWRLINQWRSILFNLKKKKNKKFFHVGSSNSAGKMKKKLISSSTKSTNISKGSHKQKPINSDIEKENECYFSKEIGRLRNNCIGFKNCLAKKGNVLNIFVCVESILVFIPSQSWWFDTGCSNPINNSLQGYSKTKEINNEVRNLYQAKYLANKI